MPEEPQQPIYTNALAIAYEKDYEIDDEILPEPFIVLKPLAIGRPHWWTKRKKVEALIFAFKADMLVEEACVRAGISYGQYRYFCDVHPHFLQVKARCKKVAIIAAKQGLLKHLPENPRLIQWYLERRQPEIYGDRQASLVAPEGATTKITGEAFLDGEGNIMVSRKTAELLEKEENIDGPTENTNQPSP